MLALGDGGVRESIARASLGTFFEHCEPEALAEAVRGFDPLSIDPRACRSAAERFGAKRFRQQLERIVADAVRASAPRGHRSAGPSTGWRAYRGAARRPRRAVLPKSCLSP